MAWHPERKKSGMFFVTECHLELISNNLENYKATGFMESFSSGACSYTCKIELKVFQLNCTEDHELLKKPEETMYFAAKATEIGKNQIGLKRICNLFSQLFEPYDNWCTDLQSDFFDGGLNYTVKTVSNWLIYTDMILKLV